MRDLLPFETVVSIVTNKELNEKHSYVCAACAAIVRVLYIDNAPHERLAYLQTVRCWSTTSTEVTMLNSKATSQLDVQWGVFDGLKFFIKRFLEVWPLRTLTPDFSLPTRVLRC